MNISEYQKIFGVGLVGTLIGLVMFGLLWLLDSALGHVKILNQPGPIRKIGLILIMIWICWHAWCVNTIFSWFAEDQLCTAGPYRFVRHPMYAGMILLGCLGVCLMFNSWIILLLPVIMYAIFFFMVRKEEAMMTAVFGKKYQSYATHTGRLFPRFFGSRE
jgi:protein-S-isoprenylcysteine O-methyltransferase Ste14